MLVPEVAINLLRQSAAVFVTEPATDGWNIDPGFNAPGGKKMPQVVVGDPGHANDFCRSIHRLLAFTNLHYGSCWGRGESFIPQLLEELPHLRDHWDEANLFNRAILQPSFRMSPHRKHTFIEIAICPGYMGGFCFAEATERQKPN